MLVQSDDESSEESSEEESDDDDEEEAEAEAAEAAVPVTNGKSAFSLFGRCSTIQTLIRVPLAHYRKAKGRG